MIVSRNELYEITGGGVSGTLINAVVKAATLLIELGRAVGNAIRASKTGIKC